MSESTSIPNGGSKELYSQNEDVNKIMLQYYDFVEKDPEITKNNEEAESSVTGSNTIVGINPVLRLRIGFDEIAKSGYIKKQLNVLNREKYVKIKDAKMKESKKAETEMEDKEKNNDRNHNGINDNLEK